MGTYSLGNEATQEYNIVYTNTLLEALASGTYTFSTANKILEMFTESSNAMALHTSTQVY